MRRLIVALSLLIVTLPVAARSEGTGVRVGYGEADTTGYVGEGSGQYTDKDPNLAHMAQGDEADPYNHSWIQRNSYGVASRLSIRAIVVEGTGGNRLALVKADHYLASDALARRAAQILDADGTSGVHYKDILFMVTHNHSSPFYFSPSWGPWLFQDVFDIRAFEHEARQFALAIERAAADLRPARMGATVIQHKIYKGNIAGATIGDDGTPAGYPDSWADFGMSVVRFDEATPPYKPIAVLVNHGQHPESNDGYDLITADYLGPTQRNLGRDRGVPLVWTQGDVGSAEGPYNFDETLPDGVVRAWAHVGHAQTERGARYLADSIEQAYDAIGRGEGLVPYSTDFVVSSAEAWVPPPISHPYASVSNCRTEATVEGNPGSPILGLPDCERAGETDRNSQTWETLKAAGAPLPEHYDAPSWGAVQENQRIRLQAFRLGEVLFDSCSCEAQMDLILNFESRANDVAGDINDGYEYPCASNGDQTWTCKAGRHLEQDVIVSDAKHARMLAEVHNDARGWDDPANAVASNTEPADPALIKGNFTKEELPAALGYALPIGVGHAAEYQGYVVSYREYMIRDHYRKALTAYGPHTADYMVTRMVRLAATLKGGPALAPELTQPLTDVDEQREAAFMEAFGRMTANIYDEYVANLPSDVGPAASLVEPTDVTRFNAATFSWRGGSNAVDNPAVRVERQNGTGWEPFADQTGEVQTRVTFPAGIPGAINTYAGMQEWKWTANFEAFDAFPRAAVPGGQTPAGTYRFVVDGEIREGNENHSYHLESAAFAVSPWRGISVRDPQAGDGNVSFIVDPVKYPRTYASGFRYISDDGNQTLCRTCSFRPWASTSSIVSATVHVVGPNGTEDVPATLIDGRWVAPVVVEPGVTVTVEPGGVVDDFGETNGTQVTF